MDFYSRNLKTTEVFTCYVCNKEFSTKKQVENHIKTHFDIRIITKPDDWAEYLIYIKDEEQMTLLCNLLGVIYKEVDINDIYKGPGFYYYDNSEDDGFVQSIDRMIETYSEEIATLNKFISELEAIKNSK